MKLMAMGLLVLAFAVVFALVSCDCSNDDDDDDNDDATDDDDDSADDDDDNNDAAPGRFDPLVHLQEAWDLALSIVEGDPGQFGVFNIYTEAKPDSVKLDEKEFAWEYLFCAHCDVNELWQTIRVTMEPETAEVTCEGELCIPMGPVFMFLEEAQAWTVNLDQMIELALPHLEYDVKEVSIFKQLIYPGHYLDFVFYYLVDENGFSPVAVNAETGQVHAGE
jgi:hypothetical protein